MLVARARAVALAQPRRVTLRLHGKTGALTVPLRAQSSATPAAPAPPSAAAPAVEAGSAHGDPAPPDKPPSLGTQFFDHVSEHPWHFFGPLLGLLISWIIRNSLSSSAQGDAIKAVDEASPLHAREVTGLGRDNGLTLAQFKRVVEGVFAELADRQTAAVADGATPPDARHLYLRPSEVEYLVRSAVGEGGGGGEGQGTAPPSGVGQVCPPSAVAPPPPAPHHLYMLHRSVAWRAGVASGAVPALGVGLPRPHFGVGGEGDSGAEVAPPSLPHLPTSLDSLGVYPLEDTPTHPLTLLSLYACLVGGRAEPVPPKLTAGGGGGAPTKEEDAAFAKEFMAREFADDTGLASPTQRLGLSVGLLRKWAALLGSGSGGGGAGAGVGGSGGDAAAVAPASLYAPPYSLYELAGVVDVLGDTHQLPTRQRTRVASAWPWRVWALGHPSTLLAEGMAEMKVEVEKLSTGEAGVDVASVPLPPRSYSLPVERSGGATPPSPSPSTPTDLLAWEAAGLAPHARRGVVLSLEEARKSVLLARAVCAWGECYNREF